MRRKRGYTPNHIPHIADVSSYCNGWIKWWTACQPAWRQGSRWPLSRNNTGTVNWKKVCARGRNGLFLVIMSTTWWAASVRSEKDWVEFDEAVEDIRWVIGQIQDWVNALPASTLSSSSETPQDLPSPPKVTWMARPSGKRRPKPTARLLEGGGF